MFADLRFAVRQLLKNPGFTLVAVLTLALGIGANTAIFSVFYTVVLHPLPFPEPRQLVALGQTYPESRAELSSTSYRNFIDWENQEQSFASLAAYYVGSFNLTGGPEPKRLSGAVVTAGFFPTLQSQPLLGRTFQRDDDQAGGGAGLTAILSYAAWQQHFGGEPQILQRTLTLDGRAYAIIGVMPRGFAYPQTSQPVEVWTSVARDAETHGPGTIMEARGYCTWNVLGRLRPAVTLAQARAEMDTIGNRIAQANPGHDQRVGVGLQSLAETHTGPIRSALTLLLGAVATVLLIAGTNLANLLLARGAARQRELATRLALGATPGRLRRQLVGESLLLAALGGVAGLFVGWAGVLLLARQAAGYFPRLTDLRLDGVALLFTLTISTLVGLFVGVFPALQAGRMDRTGLLPSASVRSQGSPQRRRTRQALVIGQIALSLLLLTTAGLLLKSLHRLSRFDPGLDPHRVSTFRLELSDRRYFQPENLVNFAREFLESLRAIGGVDSATLVSSLPLTDDDPTTGVKIENRAAEPGPSPSAVVRLVGDDFFKTLSIPLLRGRTADRRDTLDSANVVLVNEEFVRRYLPGEEALGRRLTPSYETRTLTDTARTIIGVVRDVKSSAFHRRPQPEIYLPFTQMPSGWMTVVVRGEASAATIMPAARQILRRLDPNTPIFAVRSYEDYLQSSIARPRWYAFMLGAFALTALILAAIGLYGVLSQLVAQRTGEIGVRLALGAQRVDVLKLVLGNGLKLTGIGVVIGLLGALAAAPILRSQLYGLSATDPLILACAPLLVGAVALVSCWWPAQTASRVNPMAAMRGGE